MTGNTDFTSLIMRLDIYMLFSSNTHICFCVSISSLQEYRQQQRDENQPAITGFWRSPVQVYNESSSRQQAISQSIIHDLIIGCCLPLSIVENENFRHFLHVMDNKYTPISRATITTRNIPQLVATLKEGIKSRLEEQRSLSVTADIWSDRTMRSYLGVTAHMLNNTSEPHLQTYLLACRRFKGRHSSENISAAFDEILDEYNISEKVDFIITDNAANMKKAFKVKMADHSDDFEGGSSSDEEDMDGAQLDTECLLGSRQRLSCFAHSLQLVIGDGMRELKAMSRAISKITKLASLLHTSTVFKDKFESVFGSGKSIPVSSVTRWSSQFRQVQAVTDLDHTALTQMCAVDFENVVLNSREWAQCKELGEILGPFAEATDLTQGDKVVTISMVVPTVLELHSHLAAMDGEKRLCRLLTRALRASLERRFAGIFVRLGLSDDQGLDLPFSQDVYMHGAMLDPQFGLKWVEMDVKTSDSAKTELQRSLTGMFCISKSPP